MLLGARTAALKSSCKGGRFGASAIFDQTGQERACRVLSREQ